MNVSDIIAELGNHGFTDSATTTMMFAINSAYWDVCGRQEWPFLMKSATLSFNGSTSTSTNLPSDFHAVQAMQVNGFATFDGWTDGTIRHERYDDMLNNYLGASTQPVDVPRFFYFIGTQLNFYPIPPSTTTVLMSYIATPADLQSSDVEATILIPKQFHRSTLLNGALYRLYAMEDDTDLAAGFQQFYEQGIQQMQHWASKLQFQRGDVVHQVEHDRYGYDA